MIRRAWVSCPVRIRESSRGARLGGGVLVGFVLFRAAAEILRPRLGRGGEGRGGRPGLLDEILLLLVEPGVHVVARLEDRLRAGAHDVELAVVLGREYRADRLAVPVGQRDAEIGGVEAVWTELARGVGRDLGAAQLAEILEEAPDHGLLRLLA